MNNNQQDKHPATDDNANTELLSKSQLKRDAKDVQQFASQLINLSSEKLQLLPLSLASLQAIKDYKKQSGYSAQKRHIAFIAKCLRQDDYQAIQQAMKNADFEHLRQKQQPQSVSQHQALIELLLQKGDQQIQLLVEKIPQLDRQSLRQLTRNLKAAKTTSKRLQANAKLADFLAENLTEQY